MTELQAHKYIESLKTKNGGFSNKSLAKVGLKYPLKSGWRKRLMKQLTNEPKERYIMPTNEERIEALERMNIALMKRLEQLEIEVFGLGE